MNKLLVIHDPSTPKLGKSRHIEMMTQACKELGWDVVYMTPDELQKEQKMPTLEFFDEMTVVEIGSANRWLSLQEIPIRERRLERWQRKRGQFSY